MQFCARFELTPDANTIEICRTLSPENLSKERLWEEWEKLILKGKKPSLGLDFLDSTGWLNHYPELSNLKGVPQDPEWHPEGDAWVHTKHCLDAFVVLKTENKDENLVLGLAVLLHDTGKPSTTKPHPKSGRWCAHGHEAAGEEPTRNFIKRLTDKNGLAEQIVGLVITHMVPRQLFLLNTRKQSATTSLKKLAQKTRLDLLAKVVMCDTAGRPPKNPYCPAAHWMLESAKTLNILSEKPKPILMGRHVLQIFPNLDGKTIGNLIKVSYEKQIEGEINTLEEAQKLIKELHNNQTLKNDKCH
jgi:tRNA nucleotidyltransferase (CCA-adding enzyme)